MEHTTEQEQLEAIKKWWKENGRAVIVGVVLGLLALVGGRAWLEHQQARTEQAALLYEQLSQALVAEQPEHVLALGDELVKDYGSTPYASLGALAMAKVRVDAGDLPAAVEHLRYAVKEGRDGLSHVARLRLARVLLAAGEPQAALQEVSGAEGDGFRAAYAEVRGDIHAAQGSLQEARAAYQAALAAPDLEGERRHLLQMKLDNLAAAPAGEASP